MQPPIVILHGLLGSSRNFQTWARILRDKLNGEHDIVCMDLRNHGKSATYGSLPIDYETMAQDVAITLDLLKIKSCHLIGHSMGGKVGATFVLSPTIKNIDILSLSMLDISPVVYTSEELDSVVDSVTKLSSITSEFDQLDKSSLNKLISSKFTEKALAAFVKSNLQTSSDQKWKWSFNLDSIEEYLHNILSFPTSENSSNSDQLAELKKTTNLPTLILKGAKSKFVRTQHINEITKLFPLFTIASVKDASHWLHFEQPEETANKVADFLMKVKARNYKTIAMSQG